MNIKNELAAIVRLLEGYKTYIIAVAAVVYGVHVHSADIVIVGLGLAGLRNGLSTEVSKILLSATPVQTAKEEAPQVAAEVISEVVAAETKAEEPVAEEQK